MRQRNRLALGALAAAIVAIAAGAGAYAMRPSDEPSVLRNGEAGTPQADASRRATPGGGTASSAMCAPGHPDCNDMLVQPDAELTCEEANACANPAAADCPPGAICGSGSAACAEGAPCNRPGSAYECIEPQFDATKPCAPLPCDMGGGPAENVRCLPPEPCGPAPEPGGGSGVTPAEPGVGDIAPGEPGPGALPPDAPTPCVPLPFPPDCAISSDGATDCPVPPPDCAISSDGTITCPDSQPPDDPGPGSSEPGSPGVAPPPVIATAVAQ
ncbi:MAG: hypothetical protein HY874_06465 [Chloroflexi bacterium]|nr:hypothetical protein [Chloroflexota bacterium]